jgi:hypothetical protein
MQNYINGYGNPKFKIYNLNNELIETISLPACNTEGEPESYSREGTTVHKLLSGKLIVKPRSGSEKTYRITWKLNYNRHISGDDCMKLMKVINYSDSGACRLVMVPYNDLPARTFDVVFLSDEFSLEIKKGGRLADGMYLSVLEFTTIDLHNIDWILASEEAKDYGGEHRVPYTGEKQ